MTLFAVLFATLPANASNVWTCHTSVEVVGVHASNRGAVSFDGVVKSAEPSPECDELVGKSHRIELGSGTGQRELGLDPLLAQLSWRGAAFGGHAQGDEAQAETQRGAKAPRPGRTLEWTGHRTQTLA